MLTPTWKNFKKWIVLAFVLGYVIGMITAFMIAADSAEGAEIPQEKAVRAIIGEASNQGYEGMLAVACAIRNRGTLQGVYGLNAKHVDREPEWVWKLARKAWAESAKHDVTNGATHWENTKAFGTPYWAKEMTLAYEYKDQRFFR